MSALTDFCCELCELIEAYEVSVKEFDLVAEAIHKSLEDANHPSLGLSENKEKS